MTSLQKYPNSKSVTPRFVAAATGLTVILGATIALFTGTPSHGSKPEKNDDANQSENTTLIPRVYHRTVEIEGQTVFYREAGPADAPNVLLLHGFPTSSHMFRNLIPALAGEYHVVAPDYPGYGQSSMPSADDFEYTFDHLAAIVEKFVAAVGLETYSIYLMDYGAPIGYRLAAKYPEKVDALIIQNGNAYDEGLREFWDPIKAYWKDKSKVNREALAGALLTIDATKWQYTTGVRDVESISPDTWTIDQSFLDRPGNREIQLDLFYSYGSNPPLYPEWQAYFRNNQPPTLLVWGKNDPIFPEEGAHPYKRDLKNLEFHILDTGHFALEEDGDLIARLIRDFLSRNVPNPSNPSNPAGLAGAVAE